MTSALVVDIALSAISTFPHNVREVSDETDDQLSQLASDIGEKGLLHPITVRETAEGKFEVIAGQRRCAACEILNWETIPARVIDADDGHGFLISLSENMHRRPMSNKEKCSAIARCFTECDENVQRVASLTHLSQSTIRRYLQIATLPEDLVTRLDATGDDKITLADAYDMARTQAAAARDESDNIDLETTAPKPPRARSIKANPWVFDEDGSPVAIPEELYPSVYALVKRASN